MEKPIFFHFHHLLWNVLCHDLLITIPQQHFSGINSPHTALPMTCDIILPTWCKIYQAAFWQENLKFLECVKNTHTKWSPFRFSTLKIALSYCGSKKVSLFCRFDLIILPLQYYSYFHEKKLSLGFERLPKKSQLFLLVFIITSLSTTFL